MDIQVQVRSWEWRYVFHMFSLNRELFLGGPAEYNSQMQINLLVNPTPQNPKSFEPLSVRIESQRGCLLLTQHLTCSWLVGGAKKTGEGNSEILMSVTVPGVCLFYDRLLWSSNICERFQPSFGYLALSVCRWFNECFPSLSNKSLDSKTIQCQGMSTDKMVHLWATKRSPELHFGSHRWITIAWSVGPSPWNICIHNIGEKTNKTLKPEGLYSSCLQIPVKYFRISQLWCLWPWPSGELPFFWGMKICFPWEVGAYSDKHPHLPSPQNFLQLVVKLVQSSARSQAR